jgi:hypothetical protein
LRFRFPEGSASHLAEQKGLNFFPSRIQYTRDMEATSNTKTGRPEASTKTQRSMRQ